MSNHWLTIFLTSYFPVYIIDYTMSYISFQELQALECDNTSLTYEIHQLRKQLSNLEMTLGQHAPSCQRRSVQLPNNVPEVSGMLSSGQ